MAEVTDFIKSGMRGNPSPREYTMEVEIDLAEAATAKGSALAAADTINAFTIPANTVVLFAGLECTETPAGGTGTVLDLGVKSGDVDAFVDGFAYDSASAGDYATMASTACPIAFGSAGTINVLIQAATTVSTSGKVRVFARVLDVDAVGDRSAADAARDKLA